MIAAPPSIKALTIAGGWVVQSATIACLAATVWFRIARKPPLEIEDCLLLCSWLMTTAILSLSTWAVIEAGAGAHVSVVPKSRLALIGRVSMAIGNG